MACRCAYMVSTRHNNIVTSDTNPCEIQGCHIIFAFNNIRIYRFQYRLISKGCAGPVRVFLLLPWRMPVQLQNRRCILHIQQTLHHHICIGTRNDHDHSGNDGKQGGEDAACNNNRTAAGSHADCLQRCSCGKASAETIEKASAMRPCLFPGVCFALACIKRSRADSSTLHKGYRIDMVAANTGMRWNHSPVPAHEEVHPVADALPGAHEGAEEPTRSGTRRQGIVNRGQVPGWLSRSFRLRCGWRGMRHAWCPRMVPCGCPGIFHGYSRMSTSIRALPALNKLPQTGLEPVQPKQPGDFKSPASTIPPLWHGRVQGRLKHKRGGEARRKARGSGSLGLKVARGRV